MKNFSQNQQVIKEGSAWGSRFVGIMAGGTAIIPLMTWLENKKNKKKIVRALDERIYGAEKVAADPKFEESYLAIDEEPKKGFAVGMVARFAALAPIIAAVMTPAINKRFVTYIYDPIASSTKWLSSKVGIKPSESMIVKGAMEHIEGDPKVSKRFMNNWDFLHRTIGFDFGLTIFYSILHEAAFKALAAVGFKGAKKSSKNAPNEVALIDELIHNSPANPSLPEECLRNGISEEQSFKYRSAIGREKTESSAAKETTRRVQPSAFTEKLVQMSDTQTAQVGV
jgi:hypothetical protein